MDARHAPVHGVPRIRGVLKRGIPLFITFVVGWTLVIAYFVPHRPFGVMRENFSLYFDILASVAFILGGGNLIRVHGDRIYRKVPGWGYSLVCVGGFAVTLLVGLLKIHGGASLLPVSDLVADYNGPQMYFRVVYDYLFKPLTATMYALLGFYVATASYRAFRARNLEATLLLVTATIILLGRTVIGQVLTGWLPAGLQFLHIPVLANWIMAVPNQAGNRAIMVGIALGIVSLSLRVLLGVERSYVGAEGD
jgi:hypothetical protein